MKKRLIVFLLISITATVILSGCNKSASTDVIEDTNMNTIYTPSDSPVHTSKIKPEELKAATDIPSLYISLDNGEEKYDITKEEYLPGTISVVGADGIKDIVEKPLSVKGRGNFSWSFDKKPLTLKFESKTDLLGMGKGKTWVLINNYVDKTLLRNYITFKFAADMGLKFTPDCRFVDVFLNGEYEGNFLLFEKITIAEGRVDIDKKKGGILFEIEMKFRHDDCDGCYETPSGVHIMYSDYDDSTDLRSVMKDTNKFLKAMDQSLSKGYSEYSKYIDVDSFVNWYIVNEFAKNYDSKFVTSCYCYIGSDGKLYMGPVWDYDTCYGNQNTDGCMYPEGFHVNQSPWYTMLLADKDFSNKLKERWTEAVEGGIIDGLLKHIDNADNLIAESRKLNFERWPEALEYELRQESLYYTYEGELGHFKKFITERKEWLDSVWNLKTDSGAVITNKVDLTSVKGSNGANPSEGAVNIFDGEVSTKFCTLEALPVYVEWKMKEATEIKKYSIYTANDSPERNPEKWKLSGSNNKKDWTVVSEVTKGSLPLSFFVGKEFKVDKPGKYLYYKLEISKNAGGDGATQFSELVLK